MHITTALLLVATALGGVSAHPSHRHALVHHEKRAAEVAHHHEIEARRSRKWMKNLRPKKSTASSKAPQGSASAAPAAAPPAPAAPPAAPASYKPFCGGAATSKRATDADIFYHGNTGTADSYGCNIMMIDCAAKNLYTYGMVFDTTNAGETFSCTAFNKMGRTGGLNGFFDGVLDFTVSAGETKCLAFDKNTQGGVACGPGSGGCPRKNGLLVGTWAEVDFGSNKNDHQSGSDVSVLTAMDAGTPFIGMTIKNPSNTMCSKVKSNGENFQAYMRGMEAMDGVGCVGYSEGWISVTLGDA